VLKPDNVRALMMKNERDAVFLLNRSVALIAVRPPSRMRTQGCCVLAVKGDPPSESFRKRR
jgi:hypothetical protein